MTLDEFRQEMEEFRRDVHAEFKEMAGPSVALERIYRLYESFDAGERALAIRCSLSGHCLTTKRYASMRWR